MKKFLRGDSSKIISKFLDELATEVKNYDAARDEGKTPEEMGQARREIKARVATLIAGNKASSLYKKARTRLNKASSDEMTPIMAGVLGSEDAPTGDVTIDRVRRHFSQAEEYAPFKIPTVNTGNTKLKDTKKVKYLHNNLVQEPSRERSNLRRSRRRSDLRRSRRRSDLRRSRIGSSSNRARSKGSC